MDKTKKIIILILVLVLAIAGAIAFLLHNRAEQDVGEDDDIFYEDEDDGEGLEGEETIDFEEFDNGIVYDEEMEGSEVEFKDSSDEASFYGTWKADSGHSMFMYGNVDLTIEEGGKWHGNVVDEDAEGTWTFDGKSMALTSEYFNVTLTFAEDGKLIMQEDREGNGNPEEFINTVLVKQ